MLSIIIDPARAMIALRVLLGLFVILGAALAIHGVWRVTTRC